MSLTGESRKGAFSVGLCPPMLKFDLSSSVTLVAFESDRLGRLTLALASEVFEAWLRRGVASKRWVDGDRFVDDLLIEQVERDGAPLPRKMVEALDAFEREALATAILHASGRYFHPTYVKPSGAKRARRATDADRDAFAPALDERSTDHLFRLAKMRSDSDRLLNEVILDPVRGPVDEISKTIGAMQLAAGELHRSIQPNLDLIHASAAAAAELQQRLLHQIPAPLLSDPLARALIGFDPATSRLYTDLRQRLAMSTVEQAARGINYQTREMRRVVEQFVTRGGLSMGETLATARDAMDVFRFANRDFGLGHAAAAIAAAARQHDAVVSAASSAMAAQMSIFPAGYQITAIIGLQHYAASGLVRDLLLNYDTVPLDAAPSFTDALESAHQLDHLGDTEGERSLVSLLLRFFGFIAKLFEGETDPIRRAGLVALFGYGLRLMPTALAVAGVYVATKSATSNDIAKLTDEVQQTHRDFERRSEEDRRDRLELRYLHGKAPVRTAPDAHGLIIGYAFPDQPVRVVEENSKWAEVEIYSFRNDILLRGWIYRRWLRLTPLP